MKKHITLLATLLCAALSGCSNNAGANRRPAFSAYQSPYPKGSGVAISPILEEDAIRSLKIYLKQKHEDDSFEIISRAPLGQARDFMIDEKGGLVAGALDEIWTINQSGRISKYEFIMYSDGKRGNTVGFREYHE